MPNPLQPIHLYLTDYDAQNQKENNRQVCAGMYSRKSWGGSVSPFILAKFVKPDDLPGEEDPIVSLVIFEWRDRPLIGVNDNPEEPMQVRGIYTI